jgi:hypothetical protein
MRLLLGIYVFSLVVFLDTIKAGQLENLSSKEDVFLSDVKSIDSKEKFFEENNDWEREKAILTHGVVTIEGPEGSGTGFIVKIMGRIVVLTNLHILEIANSSEPKIEVKTTDNDIIEIQQIYGAADHDIAMFMLYNEKKYENNALNYNPDIFEFSTVGDAIDIPGNAKGGRTILWTDGEIVGFGPVIVEHDLPTYEGNSGSPVIHRDSKNVIAVDSYVVEEDISDSFSKASFDNNSSPIKSKIRHFAFRIDTIDKWYPINLLKFAELKEVAKQLRQESYQLVHFITGYNLGYNWRNNDEIIIAIDNYLEEISIYSNSRREYVGSDEDYDYFSLYKVVAPQEQKRIKRKYYGTIRNAISNRLYLKWERKQPVYPWFSERFKLNINYRKSILDYIEKELYNLR